MPTISLFLFFHPQKHTNLTILMGAKQWVRALLLFLLFEPSVLDNHHATQKIYHANHHANDHHHNSHHTTYIPTPL